MTHTHLGLRLEPEAGNAASSSDIAGPTTRQNKDAPPTTGGPATRSAATATATAGTMAGSHATKTAAAVKPKGKSTRKAQAAPPEAPEGEQAAVLVTPQEGPAPPPCRTASGCRGSCRSRRTAHRARPSSRCSRRSARCTYCRIDGARPSRTPTSGGSPSSNAGLA